MNMSHFTLQPPPRDPCEPNDCHQGVESRSRQNRSGLYEEDIVITVQGAEAHTKDEAQTGEGDLLQNNRCYNCGQPSFTREHLDRCPAKDVMCDFCHKVGHVGGSVKMSTRPIWRVWRMRKSLSMQVPLNG